MTLKQFIYKELENPNKKWCEISNKFIMIVYYPYGKPKLARQYGQMSQEYINLLRTKHEVMSTIFKQKL
jgi:hypothetical protein